MSASTLPASTEASWSRSPSRIKRASGRDRRDQLRHQREIDHRRFVDDHDVGAQRMLGVMPEIRRAGQITEQPVDRGCRECFLHRAHRFRQPRGGFAGRRGERDPQLVAARLLEQAGQDVHHRPRLPGARPAGDDGELLRHRLRRGQFLQVRSLLARRRSSRAAARLRIACASCCSYSQ